MIKYILILILISNICFADDSVFLNKGQPATFDGFLLPPDKVKELQNNTLERDTYKQINDSLNRSIDLYKSNTSIKDQEIQVLMNQNDNLAKSLNDSRTTSDWTKALYFLGGIVISVVAIKGAHDLYSH